MLVASFVMLFSPLAAHTQKTANIAAGDRVRLSARSLGTDARVGIVTKVEGDKLSLVDSGTAGAVWEIPVDRLDRLEVRRANAGNHTHKGALIGMITGFVLVGTVGYVATSCEGSCEFDGVGAILAGPAGGLGALIGGLVGHSQKTEGWQRVPLPLKVNFAPTLNQDFRLSGSIAFR